MHDLQRCFQTHGLTGAIAERYKLPLICLWFVSFRTHCLGRLTDTSLAEDLYLEQHAEKGDGRRNLHNVGSGCLESDLFLVITTPSKLL